MTVINNSTVSTLNFDVAGDVKNKITWKKRRTDIEGVLKSGSRIKLFTSNNSVGYSPRKFHRVNFSNVDAVKELVNNNDLIFTLDTPQLEPGNQGYYVCSRKMINEILENCKSLYSQELEIYTEQTRAAAEQEQAALEAAELAEYYELLTQKNRLTELSERYGGAE